MNCINTSFEEGTSHFPAGSFKRPDCWLWLLAQAPHIYMLTQILWKKAAKADRQAYT